MTKRDKMSAPIVAKTQRGLSAVSPFDAERVMADPVGTEYDLVKRSKRSNPQNSLYWQTLTQVVRATGKWPTSEHLHHELKLVCGYRMTVVDWETGEVTLAVDSTAFDNMPADSFKEYFDMAMSKLAEHVGFDPLAFYHGDNPPAQEKKKETASDSDVEQVAPREIMVHLCDYARKSLEFASDEYRNKAVSEGMIQVLKENYKDHVGENYYKILSSLDLPIRAVLDKKRTVDAAMKYIANELLKCRVDDIKFKRKQR
jgi:hypothetical protein